VLYFQLTGPYPIPDGTAAEKMMAHQFKEPTPIRDLSPDVPQELVDIVERLMKKAPEQRFGSTAEVVEALRPLAGDASQEDRASAALPWTAQVSSPTTETPPNLGAPRSALPTMAALPPNRPAAKAPISTRPPSHSGKAAATSAPAALPSRQSLREDDAPAHAHQPEESERIVPGGDEESGRRSWEERLGPIGIGVGAVIAAVLAWLVVSRFF
jgi:serine/threonine-protein kinase